MKSISTSRRIMVRRDQVGIEDEDLSILTNDSLDLRRICAMRYNLSPMELIPLPFPCGGGTYERLEIISTFCEWCAVHSPSGLVPLIIEEEYTVSDSRGIGTTTRLYTFASNERVLEIYDQLRNFCLQEKGKGNEH